MNTFGIHLEPGCKSHEQIIHYRTAKNVQKQATRTERKKLNWHRLQLVLVCAAVLPFMRVLFNSLSTMPPRMAAAQCLVKPVFNWTNIFFANLVRGVRQTWKKFGELSSFLIGRTCTSRTWFGQFDELQRSCVRGPKLFTRHALGTVRRVRRTLRLIGWMKPESSRMEEEKNWDSNTWLTAWMFSASRFGPQPGCPATRHYPIVSFQSVVI